MSEIKYKVVETFISINGESTKAGQLAAFIRFKGCNLCCEYCDTAWANKSDASYTEMTALEIYKYIKETGITNVTLTGGEPLLQTGIMELLNILSKDTDLFVEIETNGSINLEEFIKIDNRLSFTMDYKLPVSGMEDKMCLKNFDILTYKDTVKFVSGSIEDLERAREIIERYGLIDKCHVYISPVFGKINLPDIVEYMKEHKMNKVNMQLQMNKFIWDPQERGV